MPPIFHPHPETGLLCLDLFTYVYGCFYACILIHQKRVLDLMGLQLHNCELTYGCWELNSGALEEQSLLLTIEPSLQALCLSIFIILWLLFSGPHHLTRTPIWSFLSSPFVYNMMNKFSVSKFYRQI